MRGEEMRERQEEAHAELDLRRHLHQPRQARIQQDVCSVRAGEAASTLHPGSRKTGLCTVMVSFSFQPCSPAELVAHRDRVGRHAKAVVAGIADIKTRTQAAPNTMHAEVRSRVGLYSHMLVM